jgi:biotin synthase
MNDAIYQHIDEITRHVLDGGEASVEDGRWLIRLEDDYLSWLMAGADRIRRRFRGEHIEICAISNVRSGNCSENCSFCAQSGHYRTTAPRYDFITSEQLTTQARRARTWGASDFGVISKGWGVRSVRERGQLTEYLAAMRETSDIGRCASIGMLDENTAYELKAMGLENYHHNLETAESHFHRVCTTHTYQENIDTVRHAVNAGLRVCSGGILGMGESLDQRIELALTLRELGVESVPLNFLSPQEGTPFGQLEPLSPLEILQNIAVFRYLLPRAEIRIAGGRHYLRDLQSMIFMAGASGIMIGDYLTTKGRRVEDDLQMLRDLRLAPREDTQQRREAAASDAMTA